MLGEPPGGPLRDPTEGAAEHHNESVRSPLWLEDDTYGAVGVDLGASHRGHDGGH